MKMRVTVALLAAALVAGYAMEFLARRSGRASFCAAPLIAASSGRPAPAKPAENKPSSPAAKPSAKASAKTVAAVPKVQRKVIAYYFHGNYRCVSCRKLEAWTAESLQKTYAKELRAGLLEWRVVNVDTKGNEHYNKDYKLYTKSVVLSDTKNGRETRWKNLGLVWSYLGDEAKFKDYVRDEVASYLKGA